MTARSPAKQPYPIGKVAFIEGYKYANGRASMAGPVSPEPDSVYSRNTVGRVDTSDIPSQHGSYDNGWKDENKRLSSVASASGIDPRLISLYDKIEACVNGIKTIRHDLSALMDDDEFQI
ncbi:Aste57867_6842 [Aphanomyces stellatus]|uniref:Aste57867_5774 protein n=1 Tax=Aphanomyces stellatus TaxID=120398 RepID=A0A485KGV1_9STRA|nr:hypothetical protein As57867_006821 [Aphanomyces stellatus]KAF0709743.1 hypothetical protein As57867_005760 [Aphanomyces stellatus]VFT82798.1 Aste57867_5774 [Aphanomyces stellatus]VFT83804.1 Aste57867_6842 [Aphanomyces stellatus]